MRVYKPEGATHYGYNEAGQTVWYKQWPFGSWSVWWPALKQWRAITGKPAVAVRPVLVDTGMNQ